MKTSKRIRENIPSHRYGRPRGIFVTIARDFQIILKLELSSLTLDFVWVDFYIKNLFEVYKITFTNSIVLSTIGLHNINTHEDGKRQKLHLSDTKAARLRNGGNLG